MRTTLLSFALTLAAAAAGAAQKPAALQKPPVLTLQNTSGLVIRAAYLSPSGDASWGKNLLRGPLAPGAAVHLQPGRGCRTYDVRLVTDGRTEFIEEELSVCGAQVLSVAPSVLSLSVAQ